VKQDLRAIRATAWELMWKKGWLWRAATVFCLGFLMAMVFHEVWAKTAQSLGVVTWDDFHVAKIEAMMSGMDYSVPSRRAAMMMTFATVVQSFFSYFLSGAISFAVMSISLSAADGNGERWMARSFGAFAFPFSVAWLQFRLYVQIVLWSLLFVIPGVIAAYRYSQAWILKCENPDWSAERCIGESAKIMKGAKKDLFRLHLSYWLPVALLIALSIVAASGESLAPRAVTAMAASMIVPASLVVGAYINFAHALFFRKLVAGPEVECTPTSPM
jgi:uncharacterized membrane protein